MNKLDSQPPRVLVYSLAVGVLLAGLGVFGLALVLLEGAADPSPIGTLRYEGDTLDEIPLSPDEMAQRSPNDEPLPSHFTLEAAATWADSSDTSAAWGLWVAARTGGYLIAAINSEGSAGYVTVRLCDSLAAHLEACPTLTEPSQAIPTGWKSFHFIHGIGGANTLRLDGRDGALSLRINQEWMWDFVAETGDEWGIWVRGGRDRPSILFLDRVRLWGV